MTPDQIQTAAQCATSSAEGKIHFGEVVARLTAAGFERYHADYSRAENTYYAPDGSSCIVPMSHATSPIAPAFSAPALQSAILQAQRGQIMYPEFSRQANAAGCVGYFVQLTGKKVQYLGRHGEIHTELFPPNPN